MNVDDDGFVVVTGRKNKGNRGMIPKWSDGKLKLSKRQQQTVYKTIDAFAPSCSEDDINATKKKVINSIEIFSKEIEELPFFTNLMDSLKQRQSFSKMICYGIGCIHESTISQYQYACALCIYKSLQISSPMEIFDPMMDIMDAEIVSQSNTKILCENELGKRRIQNPTLFYMPHCGFGLYNGLIWSNWGDPLQEVTVIGNVFSGYDQLILDEKKRSDPSNCILPLLPFISEIPLLTDMTNRARIASFSDRLLYDSFHSTAVIYLTQNQYCKAKEIGLWDVLPPEPVMENDISGAVNQELIEYLHKQQEDDSIWDHLMDCCGCDFSSLVPSHTKYPTYPSSTSPVQMVYIYKDKGCSYESVSMIEYTFSRLLPSHYHFHTLSAIDIVSMDWEKDCCLLVFPGGAANPYNTKLNTKTGNSGNARIKEYIEKGGHYLGFCAGAYYGCSNIDFDGKIKTQYELSFFDGEGKGPAMKGFDYLSSLGTYAASFSYVLNGVTHRAKSFFKGGPYFMSEGEMNGIATFDEQEGLDCPVDSVGCIECKVGDGLCILCSYHVEYDPWLLKKGMGLDGVIEELRQQEVNDERVRFLHSLLQRFGLDIGDYSYLDYYVCFDQTQNFFLKNKMITPIWIHNK